MKLSGSVFSKILKMHTGITIVTPKNLKLDGSYKVVYLLHGLLGDNSVWADCSMLPVYANDYDAIFVMPEVQRSLYTNMKYGLNYFSYITEELPIICKSVFNISTKREDTAIMGQSMGGYGALKCALSKPDQYGFCGAFSPPYLFLKDYLDYQRDNGIVELEDYKAIFGEDLVWKPEYEIMELVKKTETKVNKPVIYTTCGTEDFLHDFNVQFSERMKESKMDYTYEEWPGKHNWYFFNESLNRALKKFLL